MRRRQRRRFRPPSSASLTSGYGREETRPCISESEGRPPDSRQAAVFRSRNNIRVQKTNDPAGRRGREVHGAGDGTRTREYKLGKLIPYPIFRDLNYPSDLAVLKTNTVILANVLDEILEKRLVFQPTNNSTLKHESRQNGDFRHVISGAGDENRTRVRCLGSIGNNHYTTPALANHYNSAAVHPTGQFNETPRVSA